MLNANIKMSSRKRFNKHSSTQSTARILQGDSCEMSERNHHVEVSMLPIADTSDLESELDSNDEGNENDNEEYSNKIYNILSYKQIHEQYSRTQKKSRK